MKQPRSKGTKVREQVVLSIDRLSHDARGLAQRNGKRVFVSGALAGEEVLALITRKHSRYEEAQVLEVRAAAPERVAPRCAHAALCGGCSLQHMAADAQIALKQSVLTEQLQHFGNLAPRELLEPITAETFQYRRKARLGVRFVQKKDQVLVGFREKSSNFIADLQHCAVLDPRVGEKLLLLRDLIASLSVARMVPQIEVAMGDTEVALVLRHMQPLTQADHNLLLDFAKAQDLHLYLQPAGLASVHRIWPRQGPERLCYSLPEFDLEMLFHPLDFTQVNQEINLKLVHRALALLQPQAGERVLDLFCGLGNFTLPIARTGAYAVGVEGSQEMVKRGYENAAHNGLDRVEFHAADLTQDFRNAPWAQGCFDKILIDPPRTGALEIVREIGAFGARRIVYVSCNPATLARDAGELERQGYLLRQAGVLDMFPHTTHVESIALFERQG